MRQQRSLFDLKLENQRTKKASQISMLTFDIREKDDLIKNGMVNLSLQNGS